MIYPTHDNVAVYVAARLFAYIEREAKASNRSPEEVVQRILMETLELLELKRGLEAEVGLGLQEV